MEYAIPQGAKGVSIEHSDNKIVISFISYKEGDVIFCKDEGEEERIVLIFRKNEIHGPNRLHYHAMFNGEMHYDDCMASLGTWDEERLATEEEKETLFEALKKDGKQWNAERKRIEKYQWMPDIGVEYFYPLVSSVDMYSKTFWHNQPFDLRLFELGLVFKTAEGAISKTKEWLNIK